MELKDVSLVINRPLHKGGVNIKIHLSKEEGWATKETKFIIAI
jgi:hypothetical protein